MSVSRDAGHSGHSEVKRLETKTKLVREDNEETAETGVHVDRNVEGQPQGGNVRDGVHDAVSVLRGGGQQHHRVGVTGSPQVLHPGHQSHGVHGHVSHRHPQQVAGLVQPDMSRDGHHQVGPGHPPGLPGVASVGQHGQYEALGAPGGHRAADLLPAVEQVARHPHHLRLHLPQPGEGVRVEGVGAGSQAVHG